MEGTLEQKNKQGGKPLSLTQEAQGGEGACQAAHPVYQGFCGWIFGARALFAG